MRNCKRTWLLLAGMTLACGAYAGEPAGTVDSGMSGRIKFVDPVTGKTRQPSAAEVAKMRARAANMKRAPGMSTLPKTHADAARSVKVARDGTETLMASQDSFSTLVQQREADGSLVTSHGDAEGHAAPAAQAKEKASE